MWARREGGWRSLLGEGGRREQGPQSDSSSVLDTPPVPSRDRAWSEPGLGREGNRAVGTCSGARPARAAPPPRGSVGLGRSLTALRCSPHGPPGSRLYPELHVTPGQRAGECALAGLTDRAGAVRDTRESGRTPGRWTSAGSAEAAQSSAEGAGTTGSLICPETPVHFALSSPCAVYPQHTRVCMHTHGSTHVHKPRHARTLTHAHTWRHTCASTHARINAHVCTHTCVRTCTCMRSRTALTPAHAPGATPQHHASTRTRGSRPVCSHPRT